MVRLNGFEPSTYGLEVFESGFLDVFGKFYKYLEGYNFYGVIERNPLC